MIQSIGNREWQAYKPTSAKQSAPVKATYKSTSADAAVQQSALAQDNIDRVAISTQGREALAQRAVLSAEQAPKAQMPAAKPVATTGSNAPTEGAEASVAATAQSVAAAIEAASSSESTNLSALTEQQIKAMVSEGTVTQAEAQTELAKREAITQQSANSAASPQQQAVKQYSALQQSQSAAVFSSVA